MDTEKINKKELYSFLGHYQALPWEEFKKEDLRFNLQKRYANYALKNRRRFFITLKHAVKHFPVNKLKILDLGVFPGTWLRILQEYLSNYEIELFGAGLCVPAEFSKIMKEKSNVNIFSVNLDPLNEQLKNKNYPNQLPFENESFDFVSSLEIIEHLTSPVHMLKESLRVLKPGGKILITTPNVTRIGSIFKLLVGRSNFERVASLDYHDESDEWRPHVWEYTMEQLTDLLRECGYVVKDRAFIDYLDKFFDVRSLEKRFVDFCKRPFFCVPRFRDGILVVAEKP